MVFLFLGKVNAYLDNSLLPTIRTSNCQLLLPTNINTRCNNCKAYRKTLHALIFRTTKKKSPTLTPHKEKQLDVPTLEVTDEIHSNLINITQHYQNTGDTNSFGQIFWREQVKNLNAVPSGRRWHPLMIKWCLYIHHLSSGAYEVFRKSGCLTFPSGRTLRDYTHYIDNKAGFSTNVDKQLADTIGLDSLQSHQKYVCIVADEMKIKEGLVFSKTDGNLVGFTNLGNMNKKIDRLEKNQIDESDDSSQEIATTVFAIMVRGLIIDFKFPYASFPAHNLTGDKIAILLMEATFRLERMGLKVLVHTLDGCSSNRKYFRFMATTETPLPYKTKNPFTSENRHIYFISDPPHLIKTTRNCFYNPRRKLEVYKMNKCLHTPCYTFVFFFIQVQQSTNFMETHRETVHKN